MERGGMKSTVDLKKNHTKQMFISFAYEIASTGPSWVHSVTRINAACSLHYVL